MNTNSTQPLTALRAALYVRVSTDEQAEEGLSLDAQQKTLMAYCEQNGYTVAEVFTDAGESARSDKRPAFQRMIATAKQRPKPFDVILVHKMDRFARNREDSAVYKALLRKELGIDVVSMTERFDDTPTGKLTEGIMEVIAEFYSANLAHEVLKGMREKASRGQALGIAPVGYRIGDAGFYEVVEEDAAIVRWIFEEYASRQRGLNAIALWLRDHGLTQFGGRVGHFKWSANGVKVILQNRSYLGEFHWRTHKGEDVFTVPHAHPALIAEEQFDVVQQRLAQHTRAPRQKWGEYLLHGFGRCALCGASLTYYRDYVRWHKDREGSEQRPYKEVLACYRYYQYRCERGFRNWIKMSDAEAAILHTIQQIVDGQMTVSPDHVLWTGRDRLTQQLATLQRQLATVQSGFERQLIAFENGILDINDLRAAKARLSNTQAEIHQQITVVQQQLRNQKLPTELLKQSLRAILQIWRDELPLNERRGLLSRVLDHFEWDRHTETLSIVFRIPDAAQDSRP